MAFSPFFKRFEHLAGDETRSFLIPKGHKLLPQGEYTLLELYCNNPDCDCRRVIFWIRRSDNPDRTLATVGFGWETAEFYRGWIGSTDGADEMVGASLEALGPQSKYSEAVLALCKYALQDQEYLERIKRHYKIFRESLAGEDMQKPNDPSADLKIRVCLTANEWNLLTKQTFIENELVDSVEAYDDKRYIHWSSDDFDCVIGYISEAANHKMDKAIAKKLVKLLNKIEKLARTKATDNGSQEKMEPSGSVLEWARDDAKLRTTPYTEEELDTLTQGTIESIEDLDEWKNLVAMVGLVDAKQTIRMALQSQQVIS